MAARTTSTFSCDIARAVSRLFPERATPATSMSAPAGGAAAGQGLSRKMFVLVLK